MRRFVSGAVLGAILVVACTDPAGPPDGAIVIDGDRIEGDATVRWVELEGGFFILHGANDQFYLPINLAQAWRRDGFDVFIRGVLRPEHGSFAMMGTPVELEFIRPR